MTAWQERGLAIAESDTVKKNKLGWQVPSRSGNGTYIVNMDNGELFCTCQHFETAHIEGEEIASARDPRLNRGRPRNDRGVEGQELCRNLF